MAFHPPILYLGFVGFSVPFAFAIGALVTLEAGGQTQVQQVTSARGYLSQSELTLTFGLGKNTSYEAARRGELPVLRFGRKLRVPIVAFERLLIEAKPTAK